MSQTDEEGEQRQGQEVFFEFTVGPCDVCSFATLFFSQKWTEEFLHKELNDIDITVEHWVCAESRAAHPSLAQVQHSTQLATQKSLRRVVRSFHPSAVSFPGLASHAENIKEQHIRLHRSGRKISVQECTTLNGIPMSDYFVINMVWEVEEIATPPQDHRGSQQRQLETPGQRCRVRTYIDIEFKKSTWFQGTIVSNTKVKIKSNSHNSNNSKLFY
jgi:hypothetical protein